MFAHLFGETQEFRRYSNVLRTTTLGTRMPDRSILWNDAAQAAAAKAKPTTRRPWPTPLRPHAAVAP